MNSVSERLPGRRIVLLGAGHTNAHILRMWSMQPIEDCELTCVSNFLTATYSGMLPAVLAGPNPDRDARSRQNPQQLAELLPPDTRSVGRRIADTRFDVENSDVENSDADNSDADNSDAAMRIDLVRLCAAAGVRLITDTVSNIDVAQRRLVFDSRPSIPFDAVSVGIGSVPVTEGVSITHPAFICIKPMQTFRRRLAEAVRSAVTRRHRDHLQVTVVGSGAAGVEMALCLQPWLRRHVPVDCDMQIVSRSDDILPGVSAGMRSRVRNVLQHRKISVISGVRVTKADQHGLSTADGRSFPADVVVWAAEAAPSDFLRSVPLPHDERGFLLTDHTLRSISGDPVFAVGDCGSIERAALPKAGVYAVRQGPILWTNLQRILRGQPLQTYRPQRSFLKLLNTGDGSAVGEWKGLSFSGRWVMKLKHRIDTRFMNMYQPQPMTVTAAEMQCRGCGCKVGSDVLLSALDHTQTQVRAERSPGGIADLANMRTAERSAPAQHAVSSVTPSMPDAVRDDAAVIRLHNGGTVLASVDFFTPPFDDPFLNGRIAALHAAGDLFASGAAVKSAANVVLPEGSPQAQQQALSDFLAGAEREFRSMGAGIVGGHTISGPRWETGFTVLGEPLGGELIRKNGLQTGDVLLLTKPLGVGVLLSAHMRAALPAEDYANLLQHLLQSSRPAGEAAVRCGVTAGTDVTGFGLLGHLTEMLNASGLAAELSLRSVPLLPGTEELLRNGFESSLAPSNETFLQHCRFPYNSDSKGDNTNIFIRAMIDPQTCGGLLLGMSAKRATEYTAAITTAGLPQPAQIGRVTERTMEWIISAD